MALWENPAVRPVLEEYLAAAAPAQPRLRMLSISSPTSWRATSAATQAVPAAHAEAQKMTMLEAYDPRRARALARRLAGLDVSMPA